MMKKLFLAVLFSAYSVAACAAENQTGWKNLLNDVSGTLSSTNPAAQPKLAAKPPEAAPPVPKKIPTVNEILKNEKREVVLPEPPIDEAEEQLAPNTKKILDKIPAGVGTEKPGKKQKLSIQRSVFDESGGIPQPKTDPLKPFRKSKMEIKVSKVAPKEQTITKLDNALKALTVGQYEASIALYKEVLTKEKKNYDALFGLATAYQKSGHRTEARAAYSRLFEFYPNDESGLNNFLVLAANEAPADALTELNKLAIRNPNFPSIYAQKALILSKIGDKKNAIMSMAKALKLNPKSNIYRYNLAVMLDDAGDYEQASAVYQQLLDENYKGNPLPVERQEIIERLGFINSKRVNK